MGTGEDVLFPHQKPNAHHLTMGTPYPDDAGLELNSELSSVTIRYSRCHFNGWPWLLSNPSERSHRLFLPVVCGSTSGGDPGTPEARAAGQDWHGQPQHSS